jgi:hypothetical protein
MAVDIVACKVMGILESDSQIEVVMTKELRGMVVGLPYGFTLVTSFHKNHPATETHSLQDTYDTYSNGGIRGRLVASDLLRREP